MTRLMHAVLAAAMVAVPMAPTAMAAPVEPYPAGCADVDVVFARGTDEAPGLGQVGSELVSAVTAQLPQQRVSSYAVDYPATMDFRNSTVAGVVDTAAHLRATWAACPDTKVVLSGYSQGAAVAGYTTEPTVPPGLAEADGLVPLNADEAGKVAAVVLLGTPTPQLTGLFGGPPVTIGPDFTGKSLLLCAAGDVICATGGDMVWGAHDTYGTSGMVDHGASFAAAKVSGTVLDHGVGGRWPG